MLGVGPRAAGCGGLLSMPSWLFSHRTMFGVCRPGASVEAGAKVQEPTDRDVPTAYVQDMLSTDPVHELGLRVTRVSSSTLEFISLSEAKTELSAPLTFSVHYIRVIHSGLRACFAQNLRRNAQPDLLLVLR